MTLKIQTEKVLNNLRLFCAFSSQQPFKTEAQALQKRKIYSIFVDCRTGEFHISDSILDSEDLKQRSWKLIHILINDAKRIETSINIEVFSGESEEVFDCKDLDPLAYRVMTETFKILEMVALRSHTAQEMESVLSKLLENNDRLFKDTLTGKDLIHEAWHQVDRIGAEHLLKGYPEGTFIFRKDEYAALLEKQLCDQLDLPIKCITLTFNKSDDKIIDLTVVAKEGRYLFYDDDPELEEPSYPSIFDLLESLNISLKIPLLHAA